jgi:hypothetical protein
MALQGPAADVSERIFNDLRSKHQDVKYRAANELKDLVTVYSRGQYEYSRLYHNNTDS